MMMMMMMMMMMTTIKRVKDYRIRVDYKGNAYQNSLLITGRTHVYINDFCLEGWSLKFCPKNRAGLYIKPCPHAKHILELHPTVGKFQLRITHSLNQTVDL